MPRIEFTAQLAQHIQCPAETVEAGTLRQALEMSGLPQEHCYDIVFRHGLDTDPTGRQLAMRSSTGGLWISENEGDDWTQISNHLPPIYVVRFSKRL